MNLKKLLFGICLSVFMCLSLNAQIKIDRNRNFKEVTKENLKDFSLLEKGMTIQEFETKYKLNILTTLYDKTKTDEKKVKIIIMSRKIIDTFVIEVFSFVFIEDKLTAWGNIDDLKRSKNKEFQDIANNASKKLYLGDIDFD